MGGLRGVARRRGLVANCVGGRVFTRALSDAQVVGVCGCRRSMRSALQTAPPRRRRMLARSRPFLRHLLSAGIQAAATKARQGPERAQQERASSVWRASLCARLGPLTLPGAVGGHGRSLMAPSPPLAHPQCARGRAIPMTAASCMCFRGQRSSQHLNTAHAPLSPPLGRGEGGGEPQRGAWGARASSPVPSVEECSRAPPRSMTPLAHGQTVELQSPDSRGDMRHETLEMYFQSSAMPDASSPARPQRLRIAVSRTLQVWGRCWTLRHGLLCRTLHMYLRSTYIPI